MVFFLVLEETTYFSGVIVICTKPDKDVILNERSE